MKGPLRGSGKPSPKFTVDGTKPRKYKRFVALLYQHNAITILNPTIEISKFEDSLGVFLRWYQLKD